jgi:hypothetical protein
MKMHPTALMIAASLALYAVAPASHAKNGNGKPAIDPAAITALQKMGEFLRAQQAFSVQARMTTDDVIGSGQKVQYAGVVDLKVRRPDRMRMNISGDRRNEHIFYDGKTFTVYAERLGYYAAGPAPPTLGELKDVLEKKYAFDLPLADLFYWGTPQDGTAAIQAATRIGTSNVEGFVTDHYAFRQKDVDWEIWIEQGGRPLPRKIVITTTSEKLRPQHSMVLNWDLTAKLSDEQLFGFQPPATAHQIEFDTARRAGAGK